MIFGVMAHTGRIGNGRIGFGTAASFKTPLIALALVAAWIIAPTTLRGQSFDAGDCAEYLQEERTTSFVLVVDRSGSMSQNDGIGQAQRALTSFIRQVRPEDEVALVSFADDVRVDRPFGSDRQRLISSVEALRPEGRTRLHDAIAAGVRLLHDRRGLRVVVFLTDGDDNRSSLSLRDIRQMNIGENVMLYGVGLGNVDHASMSEIAGAGGGAYENTDSPTDLAGLYDRIRNRYYTKVDTMLASTSGITVTSLPAGRAVRVDGTVVGDTPLRLDGLDPSRYDVTVDFERGTWSCAVETVIGRRAYIRAREQEVPLSVVVETAPTRAAVFFDGDYVGLSSMTPSVVRNGSRDISGQLVVPSVPAGTHTIRVVAAPEYDFSPNQVMEFPVTVHDERVYVKALIFMQQVEDEAGNTGRPGTEAPARPGGVPRPSVPGGGGSDPFDSIRSRVPGS